MPVKTGESGRGAQAFKRVILRLAIEAQQVVQRLRLLKDFVQEKVQWRILWQERRCNDKVTSCMYRYRGITILYTHLNQESSHISPQGNRILKNWVS